MWHSPEPKSFCADELCKVCSGSSGRRSKMLQAKNKWHMKLSKRRSCLASAEKHWQVPPLNRGALSNRTWSTAAWCSLSKLFLEAPFSFLPLFLFQQECFLNWTIVALVSPFKQREIPSTAIMSGSGISPGYPESASQLLHPLPLHFLLLFPERIVNFWECQNSVNADI